MKDPSELTKNMFLFGCFCSIVSQLTADGTKQTQLFGTRPQNHDHLPKTQISFLNKKLFLLSIFSVRRCEYKGKDLSLSIPSSHRSLPTSTQLHPFTNKMTTKIPNVQPHHRDSPTKYPSQQSIQMPPQVG